MNFVAATVIIATLLSERSVVHAAFSCLNSAGQPVDFWAGLKHNGNVALSMYNPATSSLNTEESIQSTTSAFVQTIMQLYTGSPTAYLMYNDETPAGVEVESFAHMKGFFATDATSGFWVIHSAPKFPPTLATYKASGYVYPNPQMLYGQHFMCMTLNAATFETVAQALLIDNPQIYDSLLSSSMTATLPSLASLIAQQNLVTKSTIQIFSVNTVGGKHFDVFAKNRNWDSDLYQAAVSPYYSDALYLETWLNDGPSYVIGTVCTPYAPFNIYDVAQLTMPDGTTWPITDDHAKWAITVNRHYVCLGDINHESGQFGRGGGTACTYDDNLWTAFNAVVTSVNRTCGEGRSLGSRTLAVGSGPTGPPVPTPPNAMPSSPSNPNPPPPTSPTHASTSAAPGPVTAPLTFIYPSPGFTPQSTAAAGASGTVAAPVLINGTLISPTLTNGLPNPAVLGMTGENLGVSPGVHGAGGNPLPMWLGVLIAVLVILMLIAAIAGLWVYMKARRERGKTDRLRRWAAESGAQVADFAPPKPIADTFVQPLLLPGSGPSKPLPSAPLLGASPSNSPPASPRTFLPSKPVTNEIMMVPTAAAVKTTAAAVKTTAVLPPAPSKPLPKPAPAVPLSPRALPPSATANVLPPATPSRPLPSAPAPRAVPSCKALYDFTGSEPGDLSFKAGDVIKLLDSSLTWWKGELNGMVGQFPSNYATKM